MKPRAHKSPVPAPTKPKRPRRRIFRGLWRSSLVVILLLVLALTAARAAMPGYLRTYVNKTLDESPDYDGSVGEIDVHLWRGAYTIHDMVITRRGHSVPVPFFEAPVVDLSLSWEAFLHGMARGKLRIDHPKLNFVVGPTPEESQTGTDQPWLAMLDDLYPFRIDRCTIRDGEVHFRTFHTQPRIDVYLSDVQARIRNLTNVENSNDPLVATINATGTAMESGKFQLDMSTDPQAHKPSFDLAVQLLDVDVRRINALSLAYGSFDFEAGQLDFVLEATTRSGYLQGYAKPIFRNIQVIGLRDLKEKDALALLWETLVGATQTVFKNQLRDQFATRITIEGEIDNPNTSILEIVGNVLRNAFVEAFLPQVEGTVAPQAGVSKSGRKRSAEEKPHGYRPPAH